MRGTAWLLCSLFGSIRDDGLFPMTPPLRRDAIFPEVELPVSSELVAKGRRRARQVSVGSCPFLAEQAVACEIEYKRRCIEEGKITLHAQIGYRELDKTRRAYREVHARLDSEGYRVDRYGICLDWSMGYPAAERDGRPRGTGLILREPEDFARLTAEAPVAPHFGDFVLGMPSAVENTEAALAAGATTIGNLGQYFNFRLPLWHDDVATTRATVEALALTSAMPVEILVHSNLDDGFAALFRDVCCALGAVLLEKYIVEDLLGGTIGHCYGHTYSDPVTRLAFQRALAEVGETPGTMVYGNTTAYVEAEVENYASLAGYLLVDISAQKTRPTGHAINPVPVTEAMRIPEIEEVLDAHRFAHRLLERADSLMPLLQLDEADETGLRIVEGGKKFERAVMEGFRDAGIDTRSPFEMLLAIRRVGARRLEALFGPGKPEAPVVPSSTIRDLQQSAERYLAVVDESGREAIRNAGLVACVATTDVHEYGKILLEEVLERLNVRRVDAGVSVDPDVLVGMALDNDASFIALSTYNGIALDYLERLQREMSARSLDVPVFVGGKLNQIPAGSPDSLPVDVSDELSKRGAIACRRLDDLVEHLAALTRD